MLLRIALILSITPRLNTMFKKTGITTTLGVATTPPKSQESKKAEAEPKPTQQDKKNNE